MKLRVIINVLLVVGIIGLAVGAAALMVHLRSKPEAARQAVPPVRVEAPKIAAHRNYAMVIEGFGSTRAAVTVQIAPEVGGKVVSRAAGAFSGRFVTAGQELFRIEAKDYQLACDLASRRVELLAAQAARLDQEEKNLKASEKIESERIALAKRVLEDTRKLRQSNAVGSNDLDQAEEAHLARRSQYQNVTNLLALIAPQRAQNQADQAAAKVQLAQAELARKRTTYASPVTGRIRTWNVPKDQVLQAGRSYGELYATDVMEISVPVPASELQWLDAPAAPVGQAVAAERIEAEVFWHEGQGDEKRWAGTVDRIEAGLKARTRTAVLVVRVTNDPNDRAAMLDINMFCRVRITGRALPRVFAVPRNAIDSDGHAYVVVDGKLKRRSVTVMRFTADKALVGPDSGLAEGDRLVISYLAKPIPGMKVTLRDEPTSQPAGGAAIQPTSRPAGGAAIQPTSRPTAK